jgi:hypothetical protein
MINMLSFLLGLAKTITSKFLTFLISIWKNAGDVLDDIYPYVNEAVDNIERMSIYILENKSKANDVLCKELMEKYGYKEINITFVRRIKSESNGDFEHSFKTAKLDLAMEILRNRLELEQKTFVEKVVMLSLQLAVNKISK